MFAKVGLRTPSFSKNFSSRLNFLNLLGSLVVINDSRRYLLRIKLEIDFHFFRICSKMASEVANLVLAPVNLTFLGHAAFFVLLARLKPQNLKVIQITEAFFCHHYLQKSKFPPFMYCKQARIQWNYAFLSIWPDEQPRPKLPL